MKELQERLEGQNAVEIEENLQSMKTRKGNWIWKKLARKRLNGTIPEQNGEPEFSGGNSEKTDREKEELQETELSETLERLETKKTGTLKQREQLHSALQNNRKIYEGMHRQNLEQTEQEYIWIHSLADTAAGTLNGKSKIELETYVQMAYFDRILGGRIFD